MAEQFTANGIYGPHIYLFLVPRGEIYEYWDNKITENLNEYGKDINAKILVNCASNEYFNAIKSNTLSLRVITPIFMERKEGKEKIVSFYAKNARGVMARYIIQNRLLDPQDLKQFNLNGYNYIAEKSDENKFTFIRQNKNQTSYVILEKYTLLKYTKVILHIKDTLFKDEIKNVSNKFFR